MLELLEKNGLLVDDPPVSVDEASAPEGNDDQQPAEPFSNVPILQFREEVAQVECLIQSLKANHRPPFLATINRLQTILETTELNLAKANSSLGSLSERLRDLRLAIEQRRQLGNSQGRIAVPRDLHEFEEDDSDFLAFPPPFPGRGRSNIAGAGRPSAAYWARRSVPFHHRQSTSAAIARRQRSMWSEESSDDDSNGGNDAAAAVRAPPATNANSSNNNSGTAGDEAALGGFNATPNASSGRSSGSAQAEAANSSNIIPILPAFPTAAHDEFSNGGFSSSNARPPSPPPPATANNNNGGDVFSNSSPLIGAGDDGFSNGGFGGCSGNVNNGFSTEQRSPVQAQAAHQPQQRPSLGDGRLFRRRRLRPQPIRMELGDLRRMMPPPPEIQWDSGSDDGWNEDEEADDGGEPERMQQQPRMAPEAAEQQTPHGQQPAVEAALMGMPMRAEDVTNVPMQLGEDEDFRAPNSAPDSEAEFVEEAASSAAASSRNGSRGSNEEGDGRQQQLGEEEKENDATASNNQPPQQPQHCPAAGRQYFLAAESLRLRLPSWQPQQNTFD